MSELRNIDAVATPKQGEFHPGVTPTAPLSGEKHQLGVKASPEFHAETYPPGTAPNDATYTPNVEGESGGQGFNDLMDRSHGKESTRTKPEDTLMGATSKDVYKGFGYPGANQSRTEIRHEGAHKRKKQPSGLEGVGAYREDMFERTLADQRGIEREQNSSGRHGDKGVLGAEDIQPEYA